MLFKLLTLPSLSEEREAAIPQAHYREAHIHTDTGVIIKKKKILVKKIQTIKEEETGFCSCFK